ncbi:hypothetical protein C5167_014915 [Papaver somniferum]|uniref:Uncharacterized protein n=1 Tax=Papaver somniferum TaxID=3469 RepID=A0A4Y7J8X6_PAPSO|nr:hypothetical protein C5167_014915 [Papaver somniferum]
MKKSKTRDALNSERWRSKDKRNAELLLGLIITGMGREDPGHQIIHDNHQDEKPLLNHFNIFLTKARNLLVRKQFPGNENPVMLALQTALQCKRCGVLHIQSLQHRFQEVHTYTQSMESQVSCSLPKLPFRIIYEEVPTKSAP